MQEAGAGEEGELAALEPCLVNPSATELARQRPGLHSPGHYLQLTES